MSGHAEATQRASEADAATKLRAAGIAAILLVGGIHWQQYLAGLSDVPTIGVLFLANAIGAAAIGLALAMFRGRLSMLAALGGIGLSAVSLVSLAIAHFGSLFSYSEPTLRAGVVFAIVVELSAIVLLSALALRERSRG